MTRQVLIVSDKVALKLMYRQLLKGSGRVYTSADLEGCAEFMKDDPESVVILDVSRENTLITEQIQGFCSKWPAASVIALVTNRIHARQYAACPSVVCLDKPVDFSQIKKILAQIISNGSGKLDQKDFFNRRIFQDASQDLSDLSDKLSTAAHVQEVQEILVGLTSILNRLNSACGAITEKGDAENSMGDVGPFFENSPDRDMVSGGFRKFPVKCPVCGHLHLSWEPQTDLFVKTGEDSDFMPLYDGVNPMCYEISVCNRCFYAAMAEDFETIDRKRMDLISLERVNRQRIMAGFDMNYPRAMVQGMKSFELAAECYKFRKPKGFLGNLHLKAAWLARACGEGSSERFYTSRAVDSFEHALSSERILGGPGEILRMRYLLGDLCERLGKFERADALFQEILDDSSARSSAPALLELLHRRREEGYRPLLIPDWGNRGADLADGNASSSDTAPVSDSVKPDQIPDGEVQD
ncbi:MAG: hypothetical protein CVV64_06040 [Candidatus Wallbacteria bacterium HGW-Wallbacteria-1]|jgi:hypothetical protein|uniref:Response regulatory domain-containing protein n=1 Tax=Candidatus Wallbacteria bacterium HGW-Wallbacteria-1 TaxID=2013854 RepID=A0A2N1PSL1_9BACT|nr:MAG: hypothetical protein CVV64_06040 [Candidatus Wallbacteria bacterium HGW-Wallbacteria-1]